jgi:hypothetical protein
VPVYINTTPVTIRTFATLLLVRKLISFTSNIFYHFILLLIFVKFHLKILTQKNSTRLGAVFYQLIYFCADVAAGACPTTIFARFAADSVWRVSRVIANRSTMPRATY